MDIVFISASVSILAILYLILYKKIALQEERQDHIEEFLYNFTREDKEE